MKEIKKIKTYQTLGLIVAFLSLLISLTALTTTYSYTGMATIVKEKFDVSIKDVTDIFVDGKDIVVLKNPLINQDKISYGISLSNVNDFTQFQFVLENIGNTNARIKDINITGYENYQDNIDILIKGLPENKIIKSNSINKIDVITTYKNPLVNEEGNIEAISLNDINISIVLEKE